ncbi:HD-GYP domain-containing protein [Cytobacillus sp. Hz8]|uniref:HD-GYP domain-containing protein n=1 Tax=Cytobacillus sp. Hz8 TaxID=3347168 RepID=UPI0035E0FC3A
MESKATALFFLINELWKKDKLTLLHSYRVTEMAVSFAKHLQLKDSELKIIELGSLLHDIGKINIKEKILRKKGKLNLDEYEEIKHHPLYGAELLRPFHTLNGKIKEMALYHHERWDGSGYPYGIKNEDIPLYTRVLSLVDSVEAMTGVRPYRNSLTWDEAIIEVARGSGTQFEPRYSEECIKWMESFQPNNESNTEHILKNISSLFL